MPEDKKNANAIETKVPPTPMPTKEVNLPQTRDNLGDVKGDGTGIGDTIVFKGNGIDIPKKD